MNLAEYNWVITSYRRMWMEAFPNTRLKLTDNQLWNIHNEWVNSGILGDNLYPDSDRYVPDMSDLGRMANTYVLGKMVIANK